MPLVFYVSRCRFFNWPVQLHPFGRVVFVGLVLVTLFLFHCMMIVHCYNSLSGLNMDAT